MWRDADHRALPWIHVIADSESIISGVGCRIGLPIDACRRLMKRASRAAAFAATISASHDDRAINFCRADFHITAAPCMTVTRPLVL